MVSSASDSEQILYSQQIPDSILSREINTSNQILNRFLILRLLIVNRSESKLIPVINQIPDSDHVPDSQLVLDFKKILNESKWIPNLFLGTSDHYFSHFFLNVS
ncbi:hypothetical protein XENOCAPTIV_015415 [Xenoophorus captivus]|uniref:Maturase K n=1 Tax=Xenoophorus captivus TaxID=1517983 RepID=A0ABV0R0N9_9TELE